MDVARGLGRLVSVVAVIAALVAAPAPAFADCQMAPPIEEAVRTADLVFVGSVTAIAHEGRSAIVRVEEVWRGGEMPAEVTVLGGTEPAQAMEDDRTFEAGVRYVFFPFVVDGQLVDNICTATAPWVEGFAAVRPADARTPLPSATGTASGPLAAAADLALPLLTAFLIGGAAVAVAVEVGRRRVS
jgi:hypothetical protein